MIAIAIIAATITISWHWSQSRFAVGYWGGDNATRIRAAEVVQLVDLAKEAENQDISGAKGLVHFRQALIEDASFAGTVPLAEAEPLWQGEVIFVDEGTQTSTSVLFDLEKGLVGLPDRDEVLKAKPIADGLRKFFAELGVATATSTPHDGR
ncbi:hypothetical protein DTL42_01845 [Bremerella cremea]|uniref:Uncharacterized protein n=1 Tax=Bremerella cremea TaxID=1031537 RepID=A0A368KUD2_9BACT|nr:hypothetical protein [Bremerella cremea]RCS53931.1 hypothetical protein DTL42_01845 [Bremerella cremea]